jgi:hypothetical protein
MIPSRAPHTPQDVEEIIDLLGMMMLYSPTFIDQSGFFSGRNVETVFHALNEGLRLVDRDSNEVVYRELRAMSDRMRTHFEADPENKTDDTLKGRALIREMTDLLIRHIRTAKQVSPQ